jgi:flagellin-like protein
MRKMMGFFRKHRKAVSPVIAVMLLVAVAVAAVGAYFIWFRSFQTQTQKSVQQQSQGSLGGQLQALSATNDKDNYYLVIRNTTNEGMVIATTSNVQINGLPVSRLTAGSTTSTNVSPVAITISSGSSLTLQVQELGTPNDIITGTSRTLVITTEGNVSHQQYVVTLDYTDA